jgi:hypothetical protein
MNKKIKFFPIDEETSLSNNYPVPASKKIPQWFKNILPYFGKDKLSFPMDLSMPNVTIKRCVPFLDALSIGYMACLEVDLFVEKTDTGSIIRWRDTSKQITVHSVDQFKGFKIPEEYNYFVWKWHNNWSINIPNGYSIYFTHPSNRFDLPFYSISGVVDCDKYDMPVQYPFLLKKDFEGIIEAGTPLVQLIPFKRENWKSSIEKHNNNKSFLIKKNFFKTLLGSYKKNYWTMKKYQ